MIQAANEILLATMIENYSNMNIPYIETVEYEPNKDIGLDQTAIQVLSYKNYNIVVEADGKIKVVDNEFNIILNEYLYISGVKQNIRSLCVDADGYFYGISFGDNTGDTNLFYLNNITEKTGENEYKLVLQQSYSIFDTFVDIDTAIGGFTYNNRYHIEKCPFDSRFIIICEGIVKNYSGQYPHNKNLLVVCYHVNFSGGNDYDYRAIKVGSYDTINVGATYTSWTENNVNLSLYVTNFSSSGSMVTNDAIKHYKCSVNFSSGSTIQQTQILSIDHSRRYIYTMHAAFTDLDTLYFCYNIVNGNDLTIRLAKYNGTLNIIEEMIGEGILDTGELGSFVLMTPKVQVCNGEVFAGLLCPSSYFTEDSYNYVKYNLECLHIIDTQGTIDKWYIMKIDDVYLYSENLLIANTFNLYNIFFCNYRRNYIYYPRNYYTTDMVTSGSLSLYGINTENNKKTIFNRNIYNKTLVGNCINSVTQVPYNYLNDTPIIQEMLLSRNLSTIDNNTDEITKNQYEELYINNIDSYKVYDNNNGSTYNQKSSLLVAKTIFEGADTYMEDKYHITNYRINKKDGTHEDHKIEKNSRTDNIAEIKIYFYNTGADNIEIYDRNYTAPFVKIDTSKLEENKLYEISQKIKVE